jgi:hypothetical protein
MDLSKYKKYKICTGVFFAYVSKNKKHVLIFNEKNKLIHDINKFVKIFIGKSPKIPMTEFSGGYGSAFDGNTILIQLTIYKYIYIGNPEIYTFTTPNKDIIKTYKSPVGNNGVSYPFAFGEKYLYYMPFKKYVELKLIKGKNIQETINKAIVLKGFFYGLINKQKPEMTLQELYDIQKKNIDDVLYKTIKLIANLLSVVPKSSKQKTVDNIYYVTKYKLF